MRYGLILAAAVTLAAAGALALLTVNPALALTAAIPLGKAAEVTAHRLARH